LALMGQSPCPDAGRNAIYTIHFLTLLTSVPKMEAPCSS
jgi:hypothetical protein